MKEKILQKGFFPLFFLPFPKLDSGFFYLMYLHVLKCSWVSALYESVMVFHRQMISLISQQSELSFEAYFILFYFGF